jgi:uncharacterized protein YigE (DUF2233 family)
MFLVNKWFSVLIFIFCQNTTQSGPKLLIDGKIYSVFKESSTNINASKGVGTLPDNNVIFLM